MTPTNKIIKVTVSKVYVFTTTSEDVNDFTEDDVLKSDNLDHISTYVDVDDYQETGEQAWEEPAEYEDT